MPWLTDTDGTRYWVGRTELNDTIAKARAAIARREASGKPAPELMEIPDPSPLFADINLDDLETLMGGPIEVDDVINEMGGTPSSRWSDPAERPKCGARTRAGDPCRARAVKHGTRCRLHGGNSTGPTSIDGKERISAAQKARWDRYRKAKAARAIGDKKSDQ